MRIFFVLLVLALSSPVVQGAAIVSQYPAGGGGVLRWSKLWIDPSPAGNNLDGDAICYADFVLPAAATIDHLEWWGNSQPDLGIQIEFWKQDPGTIAYQPLGVFREQGAQPEHAFTTTSYTVAPDASGATHFSLDLATPLALPANDLTNPRWFVAVIGLTDVAYLEWNWAQGLGGSNQTFQFIRGGHEGGGDLYQRLGDGRAWAMAGTLVPEPASGAALAAGATSLALLFRRRRGQR